MKNLFPILIMLFAVGALCSQVPAFPGAEGGGMYATGGRGGTVYYVNTLEDNNNGSTTTREGSLRWCVGRTGKRIILFKVSGTIMLKSSLNIKNGDVTIAGQSAPGDGVCIGNFPVTISGNNVIVRYLRFRMGDDAVASGGADALGGRFFKNVIVDHCSISWSTDECASFYNCDYFTLQWSIISESLRLSSHDKGAHGYGGIWGGTNASFHHNLLAHHSSRTPRFGPGLEDPPFTEKVDHRNNVNYNYGNTYGGEAMDINLINNFYKPGPVTLTKTGRGRIISLDKSKDPSQLRYDKWGHLYVDGNVIDTSTSSVSQDITACQNATNDNWTYGVYNQFHSSYVPVSEADKIAMKLNDPLTIKGFWNETEFPVQITTHTARKAYEKVLEFAGASLRRDSYDSRVVDEVRNGTTHFIGSRDPLKQGIIDTQWDTKPAGADTNWSPWPVLSAGTAPADTNIDGIPDGWLETNYPGKLANELNESGYSYLEVYFNSIIENITLQQNQEATGLFDNRITNENKLSIKYSLKENQLTIEAPVVIRSVYLYNLSGNLINYLSSLRSNIVKIPLNTEKSGQIILVKAITDSENVLVSKFIIV